MNRPDLSWRDALPLLLEKYYSGKATRAAWSALKRMADMADELADLQDRQLMNCGMPDDTVIG
jgi:hypothetical protein